MGTFQIDAVGISETGCDDVVQPPDGEISLEGSGAEGARGNPRRSGSPGTKAVVLRVTVELGSGGLVVRLDPAEVQFACAAAGWSLETLRRRAGLSRPTLSKAARGAAVRPRTAWLVRRALGLDVDRSVEV